MPIQKSAIQTISSSADISLGGEDTLFVIFVDLCKSTDFKVYCQTNEIPDRQWIERQLIFLNRVITNIERYKGTVVKTIGDEVMGYFDRNIIPENILKCSTDMHSLFRKIERYDNRKWKIESKVSLDYGKIYDSNFGLSRSRTIDPIGTVVDRCARLNHEGKENEVVFSSAFFSVMNTASQKKYAKLKEKKELKGVGDSEYYRLLVK